MVHLPLPLTKKNKSENEGPKPSATAATPQLFLIDAMSFIFRAYHAMARQRPMSTRSGLPTGATYVFVNMINKLREDFKPDYIAAVFDLSGPTFRDEQAKAITAIHKWDAKSQQYLPTEYLGYKANRPSMPEDLVQQLPFIRKALEAYRIPILAEKGFEADDIIGTLAKQAAKEGRPVCVVSGDKDMLQLVGGGVTVLNPQKDNLLYDAAKVEEILGVPPEKVVDVMALRGDAVDNVPGAPGIGDKGSVELVQRFGSVEKAIERAAEIERKTYRESLQHNQQVVLESKKLVTIDRDAPIVVDLKDLAAKPPDNEACRALFAELQFTSLLKQFLPTEEPETDAEYGELLTEKQLKALLEKSPNFLAVAFDLQTEEPKADLAEVEEVPVLAVTESGDLFAAAEPEKEMPLTLSLCAEKNKAYTYRFGGRLDSAIARQLGTPEPPLAVHQWKAAWHRCRRSGVELAEPLHETALYSWLLDPGSSNHSLANVAARRLNQGFGGSLAQAADLTGRLARQLRAEIEEAGLAKLYDEIERPLAPVLARMEAAGVKLDTHVLAGISAQLAQECGTKAHRIHELAGSKFNINSPKQLSDVLFNKLMLPKPPRATRGATVSTAVEVLEELAEEHEIARLVLEYRHVAKLKSTYVDTLPLLVDKRTGRLHTTFVQTGAATGRLASVDPNLQNIPIRTEQGREIRAAFIADEGNVLLSADYSQIELRLLAHYSEDPALIEAFRRGDDIHTLTASEVFGVPKDKVDAEHRRRAKAVNFGIVYGLSAFGLAQQLDIEQKEAKIYIDGYFAKYPGVRKFIDRTIEETKRTGKVRTLFSRLRPIPDINSANPNLRGFAERTAVNTPLQGTAADLIKIAMVRIDAELRQKRMRSRMTLQVHDELVFEAPESEVEKLRGMVKEKMEKVHELKVPLEVEVGVGKNWRDLD